MFWQQMTPKLPHITNSYPNLISLTCLSFVLQQVSCQKGLRRADEVKGFGFYQTCNASGRAEILCSRGKWLRSFIVELLGKTGLPGQGGGKRSMSGIRYTLCSWRASVTGGETDTERGEEWVSLFSAGIKQSYVVAESRVLCQNFSEPLV